MKIDLQDVKNSGCVKQAILDYCADSDSVASGDIGPTFSCSGPGSGWQKNHNENDYAARALADDYGAAAYVDCDDGREATLDADGDVVWSDDSVVELVVPDEAESLAHPEVLVQMAVALIECHSAASDKSAWQTLLMSIRDAAAKIEDLDLSDLD